MTHQRDWLSKEESSRKVRDGAVMSQSERGGQFSGGGMLANQFGFYPSMIKNKESKYNLFMQKVTKETITVSLLQTLRG